MNNLEVIEKRKIEDYIYEIDGRYVITDSDLAIIYNVQTKRINEAVKNNPKKFPIEYSWILNDNEYDILRSKISTTKNIKSYSMKRYNPRVFTEEGCLMLGTILKSDVAVNTTLLVIEAFVAMKKFISSNLLEQRFINNMVLDHDERIKLLESNFSNKTFSNEIFYEGQIFDAYYLLLKIFDSSKKSIIIIDNYADKELFKLLSKTDKKVTIYSKNINNDLIKKYKKQYDNVTLIENDSFHDRFIIIDEKNLYHCGSSFKDLGTKCFAINRVDNKDAVKGLLSSININRE